MITKELREKIQAMPWPVPRLEERRKLYVTAEILEAGGDQMLLATFCRQGDGPENRCRLLLSKKASDFRRIDGTGRIYIGKAGGKPWDWDWWHSIYSVYPEISEKDEACILDFCREEGEGRKYTGNHGLDTLWELAVELRKEKREREAKARGGLQEDDVYQCPEEPPEGFWEWAHGIATAEKTIIYKKGNRKGLCYACGREVTARTGEKFRQYQYAVCPSCGERVFCYLDGGASWKASKVETVCCFQKSEDGTFWIRKWNIQRDPAARYKDMRQYIQERERYAIRGGKTKTWRKEVPYYMGDEYWACSHGRIDVYSADDYYTRNLREAAAGTSLQYMCLPEYIKREWPWPEKYAMDSAKYPVLEFLYKGGFKTLVRQRVCGGCGKKNTPVNWRGKKLRDCFAVPVSWLKAAPPEDWDVGTLERCVKLYRDKPNASLEEVRATVAYDGIELLDPYLQTCTVVKAARYLDKQKKGGYTDKGLAYTYRDYLKECRELGLDLSDKQVMFPPDLQRAHERTMREVRYKQDEKKREAFAQQVEQLQKWSWEKDGLAIRPAGSLQELVREGAELHHCVAGYADRMAEGKTAIFFIRRADAPDTPYYTLELRDKRVIQCRTLRNKSYELDPEIRGFVGSWLETVVHRNKKPGKKARKSVA